MTLAQLEAEIAQLEAEIAAIESAVLAEPEYRGCAACQHIYVGRRGDTCPRCGTSPTHPTATGTRP